MDPVIHLEPNPDILKAIAPLKGSRIFVGFAAETGDPTAEAQRKLTSKGLDMIVANDVTAEGAGFAVDTNRVTFISANEQPRALPLQSKLDVGRAIIEWIEANR
jgi:phosphopantothenoylcysteine decarboxylase/phosphopantothenate--cysteine ligase